MSACVDVGHYHTIVVLTLRDETLISKMFLSAAVRSAVSQTVCLSFSKFLDINLIADFRSFAEKLQ